MMDMSLTEYTTHMPHGNIINQWCHSCKVDQGQTRMWCLPNDETVLEILMVSEASLQSVKNIMLEQVVLIYLFLSSIIKRENSNHFQTESSHI